MPLEIKWGCLGHGLRSLLPDVRRVNIQLDCVAIGIVEVDGFAHLVIVRLNLEARRFELQLRLTEFVDPGSDLAERTTDRCE